jgi:hypothetical protein
MEEIENRTEYLEDLEKGIKFEILAMNWSLFMVIVVGLLFIHELNLTLFISWIIVALFFIWIRWFEVPKDLKELKILASHGL